MTILVIGGTGTTGRHVVTGLGDTPLRVATRSTGFDWDDPDTYAKALHGVTAMYLVPPIGATDPAYVMGPFLEMARDQGVERAVLLSSSALAEGGPGVGQVHATIAETFPEWAVLRPSWFMQNFTEKHVHADSIRDHGEIVTATGDGRVGFIDAADIAAVAVRALTDPVPHNTDHVLTGPQALSYADVAATITEVTGRPVRHRAVSAEQVRDRFAASGIPVAFAAMLAGLDEAIAAGAEDRVTTTVADVTGRAPTNLRRWVEASRKDG